jgi:hypothetical protein
VEHDELMSGAAMPYLEALLGYPIKQDFINPKLAHITDARCPDQLWPLYHELQGRKASRDRLLATTA